MAETATHARRSRSRGDTAEQVLDVAEVLIESRGYSAISYADIAGRLGIRKASIHYHFPSKVDLGVAVVDRYAARFREALAEAAARPDLGGWQRLEVYFGPFRAFAGTADQICLCGALAGEMPALPAAMQTRVAAFFGEHQRWLADILARGAAAGDLTLPASPKRAARLVFSALQGALLVKRTTGDSAQVEDVIAMLDGLLRPDPGA